MTAEVVELRPQARVLPHALEAERSVLGGILLAPKALAEVKLYADQADFYHPAHAAIFDAMVTLDEASKPVDWLGVADQMRASETAHRLKALGGEAYFSDLTSSVVTVENIAFHAKLVASKARVRRTIEAAQAIAARGFGDYGDSDEFLAEAEAQLATAARARLAGGGFRPISAVVVETLREMEREFERQKAGGPATVIPTGFRGLDRLILGWEPATMAILAARPSVGKTALMMDVVEFSASTGTPCFVGTREMRDTQLVRRRLAALSGIPHERIRRAQFEANEWAALHGAAGALFELPIALTQPFRSLLEFERDVRLWRARQDPSRPALVALDYLQLVDPPPQKGRGERNREREIGEMSSRLKSLAQELGIALLVLSQLSRALEKENRKPRLSDLRDSGSIEQDADVVAFIHRPKLRSSEASVLVEKQRNGPLGEVSLRFDHDRVRFCEVQDELPMMPPAPPDEELDEP